MYSQDEMSSISSYIQNRTCKINVYIQVKWPLITAAVHQRGPQVSWNIHSTMDRITAFHKILIQHKGALQELHCPSPSISTFQAQFSLGKMHACSIWAQHQRYHGNSPPFLSPPQLPSTASGLSAKTSSVQPQYSFSVYTNLLENVVYIFFPQCDSCIGWCNPFSMDWLCPQRDFLFFFLYHSSKKLLYHLVWFLVEHKR